MIEADKSKLKTLLEGAYAFFDKQMTPQVAKIWIDQMHPYQIHDIEKAFNAFYGVMRRPPLPSDILQYLPDALGHPLPEEAWNYAPKTEMEGGYVTEQMMAAIASAQSSLDVGNLISARVAFLETYRREMEMVRANKIRATFFYTAPCGLTREQFLSARESHILAAANKKWIEPSKAFQLICSICDEQCKSATPYLMQLGLDRNAVANLKNESTASNRISGDVKSIVQSIRVQPDPTENRQSAPLARLGKK